MDQSHQCFKQWSEFAGLGAASQQATPSVDNFVKNLLLRDWENQVLCGLARAFRLGLIENSFYINGLPVLVFFVKAVLVESGRLVQFVDTFRSRGRMNRDFAAENG